jgi:hypothetical protein
MRQIISGLLFSLLFSVSILKAKQKYTSSLDIAQPLIAEEIAKNEPQGATEWFVHGKKPDLFEYLEDEKIYNTPEGYAEYYCKKFQRTCRQIEKISFKPYSIFYKDAEPNHLDDNYYISSQLEFDLKYLSMMLGRGFELAKLDNIIDQAKSNIINFGSQVDLYEDELCQDLVVLNCLSFNAIDGYFLTYNVQNDANFTRSLCDLANIGSNRVKRFSLSLLSILDIPKELQVQLFCIATNLNEKSDDCCVIENTKNVLLHLVQQNCDTAMRYLCDLCRTNKAFDAIQYEIMRAFIAKRDMSNINLFYEKADFSRYKEPEILSEKIAFVDLLAELLSSTIIEEKHGYELTELLLNTIKNTLVLASQSQGEELDPLISKYITMLRLLENPIVYTFKVETLVNLIDTVSQLPNSQRLVIQLLSFFDEFSIKTIDEYELLARMIIELGQSENFELSEGACDILSVIDDLLKVSDMRNFNTKNVNKALSNLKVDIKKIEKKTAGRTWNDYKNIV